MENIVIVADGADQVSYGVVKREALVGYYRCMRHLSTPWGPHKKGSLIQPGRDWGPPRKRTYNIAFTIPMTLKYRQFHKHVSYDIPIACHSFIG
jgi:hypothetical protein